MKIICVGKIKEDFYKKAIQEYLKRLAKYTKLEVIEVEEFTQRNKLENLEKEKEQILKRVNKKDFVITLDINGEELSSVSFSKKMEEILIKNSNVVFIVGSSDGLDEEIKKRSDYSLSFSKMTFPHQLFRVILLEQIYRSFKIINNEEYHK